jgi:hypothetical protein
VCVFFFCPLFLRLVLVFVCFFLKKSAWTFWKLKIVILYYMYDKVLLNFVICFLIRITIKTKDNWSSWPTRLLGEWLLLSKNLIRSLFCLKKSTHINVLKRCYIYLILAYKNIYHHKRLGSLILNPWIVIFG